MAWQRVGHDLVTEQQHNNSEISQVFHLPIHTKQSKAIIIPISQEHFWRGNRLTYKNDASSPPLVKNSIPILKAIRVELDFSISVGKGTFSFFQSHWKELQWRTVKDKEPLCPAMGEDRVWQKECEQTILGLKLDLSFLRDTVLISYVYNYYVLPH